MHTVHEKTTRDITSHRHVQFKQTGRKGAQAVKRLQVAQPERQQPVRKAGPDTDEGNGDGLEGSLSKKDVEAAIPMGVDSISEHDEKSRDF